MSDRRRFECHRAAKGAFQQRDVRASLRRAVQQLRRVQPWPPAVVVRPQEPAQKEPSRG